MPYTLNFHRVLKAPPALDGAGIAAVFLDPAVHSEAPLGLFGDLLGFDMRGDTAIGFDLFQFADQINVGIRNPPRRTNHL